MFEWDLETNLLQFGNINALENALDSTT